MSTASLPEVHYKHSPAQGRARNASKGWRPCGDFAECEMDPSFRWDFERQAEIPKPQRVSIETPAKAGVHITRRDRVKSMDPSFRWDFELQDATESNLAAAISVYDQQASRA